MKICGLSVSALLFLILFSCSKDDGGTIDGPSESVIDFVAIGEDTERVYQYSYNSANEIEEQLDLTQELGVSNTYITLRQKDNLLSFYEFDSGNFSLIQKDIATGFNATETNFYRENDERNILWGTNDENTIYLGFYEPEGSSNFGLLQIDNTTGSRTGLAIEEAIQMSFQPVYHRGKLWLTYLDLSNNYKIAIIDTESFSITRLLNFGAFLPNIFINDEDDVVVLKSIQGENYSYTVYDANSLEPGVEFSFALTRYFDPGFLNGRFIEDKLYYYVFYAQPADFRFGPAYFDLNSNEETLIDFISIALQVENELGKNIQLTSQGIDEENGTFLIGYANLNNSTSLDGGVIAVSFEGELLENIELPFVPTYFLTRQ